MIFLNSLKNSNTAQTIMIVLVVITLSACTHITYTPEESAKKISELETKNQKLERLWKEAETDLSSCLSHLKDCQPLICDPDTGR